jgi:hypothetical protein
VHRAELLFVLLSLATPGLALGATEARAARLLVDGSTATAVAVDPSPRANSTRATRLLAEGGVGAGLGLVLPFVAYGSFTALQTFVGFFAGFLSATVIGAVLAPLGIIIAGRLLGADGGVGRSIVGALLGLLAGLVIGVPLATLPGAGYLVGLGLLWALPSVGTLVAFEWGREALAAPTGAVVLRF